MRRKHSRLTVPVSVLAVLFWLSLSIVPIDGNAGSGAQTGLLRPPQNSVCLRLALCAYSAFNRRVLFCPLTQGTDRKRQARTMCQAEQKVWCHNDPGKQGAVLRTA